MKGEPRKCATCRGQGVVIQMRQIGPGMVQQLQARCGECVGGFKVTMKKERQVLEVNVDKGATHNTKLRFGGMGNESPNAEPGDVVFVLQQKEHATFKRKGADLLIQKDVSLVEALCGLKFVIKQLDGRSLLVQSKPGQIIRPEVSAGVPYVMCVDGEGMPKCGNPSADPRGRVSRRKRRGDAAAEGSRRRRGAGAPTWRRRAAAAAATNSRLKGADDVRRRAAAESRRDRARSGCLVRRRIRGRRPRSYVAAPALVRTS